MEWNDDAIVLSSRAHGENGTILEKLPEPLREIIFSALAPAA